MLSVVGSISGVSFQLARPETQAGSLRHGDTPPLIFPTVLTAILVVLVILMLLGSLGTFPALGHSRNWGYGPSGGLGLVVLILLVLLLLGRF
ncbi:MAG: DUF3309 domain-containing protein [Pirellulaceae bacterium]|nr:DUF3309 domain-containing protein [Pirellulaceae bacterium]